MVQISDLPVELLIDSLLPCLVLRDLLALACTSRFFALVCSDDTFWKRKTTQEYNFSGAGSARTSGFKHVYRGLRSPRVFVWGDAGNGRLAPERRKHAADGGPRYIRAIDYPTELDIGRRVVHLAAGGWSFHALTDDGRVLVWGQLDSQAIGLGGSNLAHSGATVNEPLALILPQKIKSLSVGRRHAILLDVRQDVWIVLAWALPARLVAPAFDGAGPDSTVVQVEAGWDVCAFLTETGAVFVVFPFHGSFAREAEPHLPQPRGEDRDREILRQGDEVQCQCWDIQYHPTQLPALPTDLPTLHSNANDADVPPKLVKIAAGDQFVVGLTDGGHVLKLDLPTRDESELRRIISRGDLRWNYLPRFCDAAHVRSEPGFRLQGQQQTTEASPLEDLTVTHISAQFRTFVVYSTIGSSVVLLGNSETSSEGTSAAPKVIPELQHRDVISVVLGDYHYCALTSNGELFSWGKYSNGALGLGSPSAHGPTPRFRYTAPPLMLHQPDRRPAPQDAEVPTRVSFHHEDNVRDRYVFAVAAAGWHCGALVIDLHSTPSTFTEGKTNLRQEDRVKQDRDNHSPTSMENYARNDAEASSSQTQPIARLPTRTEAERAATHIPQITLPIVRGGRAPFRIGYAARGAYVGRGVGRGFADSNSGSGVHPGRAEE